MSFTSAVESEQDVPEITISNSITHYSDCDGVWKYMYKNNYTILIQNNDYISVELVHVQEGFALPIRPGTIFEKLIWVIGVFRYFLGSPFYPR